MIKRFITFVILFMLMCGFTSCIFDELQESPATFTPEQIALQNRTEEEIIANISDEPYEDLITAQTNHLRMQELINLAKYFGGKETAPDGPGAMPLDLTLGYPLELTLEEVNKRFPIQCLRKSGEGRYYAVYLNEYGDPFYLCFKKVQTDTEENKWEYLLHRWLIVPTVTSASFAKSTSTIDDYIKQASYNNFRHYSEEIFNETILCISKNDKKVLRLNYILKNNGKAGETSDYTFPFMDDGSFMYEIAKEDYPK